MHWHRQLGLYDRQRAASTISIINQCRRTWDFSHQCHGNETIPTESRCWSRSIGKMICEHFFSVIFTLSSNTKVRWKHLQLSNVHSQTTARETMRFRTEPHPFSLIWWWYSLSGKYFSFTCRYWNAFKTAEFWANDWRCRANIDPCCYGTCRRRSIIDSNHVWSLGFKYTRSSAQSKIVSIDLPLCKRVFSFSTYLGVRTSSRSSDWYSHVFCSKFRRRSKWQWGTSGEPFISTTSSGFGDGTSQCNQCHVDNFAHHHKEIVLADYSNVSLDLLELVKTILGSMEFVINYAESWTNADSWLRSSILTVTIIKVDWKMPFSKRSLMVSRVVPIFEKNQWLCLSSGKVESWVRWWTSINCWIKIGFGKRIWIQAEESIGVPVAFRLGKTFNMLEERSSTIRAFQNGE